jgi:hypothetical protein
VCDALLIRYVSLLLDARFFITQLAALDSVRALGNQLEVAANNIKV